MSFNVRLHGHQGIVPMQVQDATQDHKDSVYNLKQPYVWTQTLSVSGVAVSSVAATPLAPYITDVSSVLRIEVPDGQAIRYEINSPNISRVASSDSPKMSGVDQFQWGAGWKISIIDAAGLP